MTHEYGHQRPKELREPTAEELAEVYGQDFTDTEPRAELEPEPEEQPDYTDTAKWIPIHTQEYVDGARLGAATAGLNISTGKTLITYRLRMPGEEGLDHVVGTPFYPIAATEPAALPERKWMDGEWQPGLDPKLMSRSGITGSTSQSGRSWLRIANRD